MYEPDPNVSVLMQTIGHRNVKIAIFVSQRHVSIGVIGIWGGDINWHCRIAK